jgi:hypothetical protein
MAGMPLRRQRKPSAVDPITGELVPFPYLSRLRAGLSYAQWRALSPGEKIERLLGVPLHRVAEILSWGPTAELDPQQLKVQMQVWRVVFRICTRALLDGKLGREVPS